MKNIKLRERFLLLQVIDPHYHRADALANMRETEQLVSTYGGEVIFKDIQHLVHPDRSTYIGKGKLKQLLEVVKQQQIDVLVLNDIVKSGQLFRLEKELWQVNTKIQVWDRVDLILNIFDQHAQSSEAKLQIELARIQHAGSRIFGLGGTVLSRQGGGIGTRGIGETNIERERRLIKDRARKIKKELKKLAKKKQARIEKRQQLGMKTVALVGYTSAGKTTLFNQFTGRGKTAESSLFTTLDSVVGKPAGSLDNGQLLISDTIGFVENLPPSLVETFRSTLMETVESAVLLHVIDASDKGMDKKITVVEEILSSLKADQSQLKVFNKIDQLTKEELSELKKQFGTQNAFYISATHGQGINELQATLTTKLN